MRLKVGRSFRYWAAGLLLTVALAVGWNIYQARNIDVYAGMSVIPGQHPDIPLYKGLNLEGHRYVMNGERGADIYTFYRDSLTRVGWVAEYEQQGEGGFMTRWIKEGFDGELWISATYSPSEKRTVVLFDKTPHFTSTVWIHTLPDSICIDPKPEDSACTVLTDGAAIEGLVKLINQALDWKEPVPPGGTASRIDVAELPIQVQYDRDQGIYFQSDKGTKWMKPEREFWTFTSLPR